MTWIIFRIYINIFLIIIISNGATCFENVFETIPFILTARSRVSVPTAAASNMCETKIREIYPS